MNKKIAFDPSRIRELLIQNYEDMRAEGGHPLTPPVLERAIAQVEAYLRKHSDIAEKVMETEVKLHSQELKTASGSSFMIEGVVDLVRDGGRTIMYDLKTQSAEQVKGREEQYQGQLNVYAWLWGCSRDQVLDAFGVLALGFPKNVMKAFLGRNEEEINQALEGWDSEILYDMDKGAVDATIGTFKEAIEAIERHEFPAPKSQSLAVKKRGDVYNFATQFCANCDVRFSCNSYQEHVRNSGGKRFKESAAFWEAQALVDDLEQWVIDHTQADAASVPGIQAPGGEKRARRS